MKTEEMDKAEQPEQADQLDPEVRVETVEPSEPQAQTETDAQPDAGAQSEAKPQTQEALSDETSKFARLKKLVPSGAKKKQDFFLVRCIDWLFSPITDLLDGIDIDFADRSRVRKTLIAMFKLKAPICIFIAVVIALSACYFLLDSDSTASTEMSLNYEESANGLNPNSTRFNIYDLISQEVVEGMLSYCGIDTQSVDLNEVTECISVRPTNAKAFSEDNLYISTSYRITMRKPASIEDVSVKELLTFLCKAYKDNLYSKYTENRAILDFDIDTFHDEEFMQIADLLDLKARQIEKYLNTRVKQSKTFTEKESDETFKSLSQKVEDLRNYDIAKYRAFIIQAGCSHDKARYIRTLSYINRIKGLSFDKDMASYTVRNDGIKIYNEAMISVVMIPSIDESKNTYYMSKTKTGMDYMASQADDFLLTAQETAKTIETNKDIIAKMQAGTNASSDIDRATGMILDIRQKFTDLSRQIETVDKAYVKYKTKDYLTFKTANPSLTQKMHASTLFMVAAALLAGIYAVIWLKFRFFGGGKESEGISIITLPVQR